jgi:hypothetical protein
MISQRPIEIEQSRGKFSKTKVQRPTRSGGSWLPECDTSCTNVDQMPTAYWVGEIAHFDLIRRHIVATFMKAGIL